MQIFTKKNAEMTKNDNFGLRETRGQNGRFFKVRRNIQQKSKKSALGGKKNTKNAIFSKIENTKTHKKPMCTAT